MEEMESRTVGAVFLDRSLACPGYTLFSAHKATYLIDLDGRMMHSWPSRRLVFASYLLESGNLVRDGNDVSLCPGFRTGGAAGYVEVVTWENELVWWWCAEPRSERLSHHDLEPIGDGRVLVLCWERVRRGRCESEGRLQELLPDDELWDNLVIELCPPYESLDVSLDNAPRSTTNASREGLRATETWRWSQFDHLVQDTDPTKKNYGRVGERLDRFDLNYAPAGGKARSRNSIPPDQVSPSGLALFDPHWKIGKTGEKDWLHANSIAYDEERAYVLVSYCVPSEVIIISRASGDVVFRFGNPAVCRRGDPYADRVLYMQHSAQFSHSPRDSPNLKILLFNNGTAPHRLWSTVDEYEVPSDSPLNAVLPSKKRSEGGVETRANLTWSHGKPVGHRDSFYAHHSSGVHRCPNGNTLICLGPQGILFEVTPDHEECWRYVSPVQVRGQDDPPAFVRQGQHRAFGKFGIFFARRYAPDYPAFADKIFNSHTNNHLEDPW